MDSFIDKYGILTDSQYGFRSNRSTSLALIDLVEELTTSIDDKKFAIGVFTDLKKAFDTIDHHILLQKLEMYGIRGIGLNWIKSYLEHRQQFVQMGEEKSKLQNTIYGVPQGSILGPKLFILYINDIVKTSDLLKFVIFADDTNIFCKGENLQHLLKIVSEELVKLKLWFDLNKLSLNIKKTKFMIFGNRRIPEDLTIEVLCDNTRLERVYENSFLGVIIDHKLSWKPQVNCISSKLAEITGILCKVRYILSQETMYILYCALFLPYLSYCTEVWGNTYKTTLKTICTMQKKAMRIVCNVGYYVHTNYLFLKLQTLKFKDIVDLKTTQIMYKAKNKVLPNNIQKWFKERDSRYNLRRRGNLSQSMARTTLKSMCISVNGVRLWNN